SPIRAKKWLYLLAQAEYLTISNNDDSNNPSYQLGNILTLFSDTEDRWWFYKEMLNSWRTVESLNAFKVLRGGDVNFNIQWPPIAQGDVVSLEEWMSRTSLATINILKEELPLTNVKSVLDVGGGEATIACSLAQVHPQIHFTVYNLPIASSLGRKKVKELNLTDNVNIVEGNFLIDQALPSNFDLILFSRVLCDWPDEVCDKLFKMSYEALNEGGTLIICEPFKNDNQNMMLVWEYRYMFWDSFGKAVFKDTTHYTKMLEKAGFSNFKISQPNKNYIYRVVSATKNTTF
ncbi:MAG: methyltransferase, partial [Candidatus Berkiella sp.]